MTDRTTSRRTGRDAGRASSGSSVDAADDPSFDPGSSHARFLEGVAAWIDADVDADDQRELLHLLELADSPDPRRHDVRSAALADLRDRFAGPLEFGTAGMRGRMGAGQHRMNRAVVVRAAAGLSSWLWSSLGGAAGPRPRVVIGFDGRHRSRTFARDSAAVLAAADVEALVLPSALPTPVLAFAVRHLGADAGIMVTASHNPKADNGYKVYLGGRVVTGAGQGAQLVPPTETEISAAIATVGPAREVPRASDGWTVLGPELVDAYVASVVALSDGAPRRVRVVTTALHGVGAGVLARVLREAGFRDVIEVEEQVDPDPDFPTVAFPNPEEPGAMDLALAYAQDANADVVIANDPDADRCAVAVYDRRVGTYQGAETARSNGWRTLHGDEVGSLLGEDAAARVARSATGGVLASSVVSSRLLARIAASHRLRHETTLTGFKWISRVDGLAFGYEEALGYCADPERVRDKDGISAALLVAQLVNRLAAQDRSLVDALDDLARAHGLHVSGQLSARFDDLDRISDTMAHLRSTPPRSLGGAGVSSVADLSDGLDGLPPTDGVRLLTADSTRVVVRPSGTEPKVKCYLEVVVPVAPDASHDDLTAARAFAQERLERVQADMRRALGL
ncbi:phospho-sugar mutase [Cellulosimicrobium arenosum]|uniref:Phospho-sugar mutase n=1 Tax=Cellulosimicrobium arenosum TaxID=2708133 RepID=A0A927IZ62_9MICO|nr:phospho-sugar mutase [Cellulosimicrobium arenosum]MBD8078083.1 phospho-sugar mutase [Cellulosimicrobium arenosum]